MKRFRLGCKLFLRELYWGLRGKWVRNPALPVRPRKFLFVCKGNICRSPAAEHLAGKVLGAGMEAAPLVLASAGLEVMVPENSPAEAVQAGELLGIDLRGHQSVKISANMIEASDMVLVMEARQLRQIVRRFPAHRHRFFLLPLFGSTQARDHGRYNIQDPYGKPVAEFSRCFANIRECLLNLSQALAASSSAGDPAGDEKAGRHPEISNW